MCFCIDCESLILTWWSVSKRSACSYCSTMDPSRGGFPHWPQGKSLWCVARGLPSWLSGKESACQCREMQVWSLSQEDPLEEEMAAHSSILAGIVPWTEEPGRLYSPWGHRVLHDWATNHACVGRTDSRIMRNTLSVKPCWRLCYVVGRPLCYINNKKVHLNIKI